MKVVVIILFVAVLAGGLLFGWGWLESNIVRVAAGVERLRKRLVASPAVGRLRAHYPRVARFFAARFARGEYLGLHLTIGFLVMLLEGIAWRGLDNLLIPLGAFILLNKYIWLAPRDLAIRFEPESVRSSIVFEEVKKLHRAADLPKGVYWRSDYVFEEIRA